MTTEVKTQLTEHPLASPKAEPGPEKKPEPFPRSHGDVGFQKEPVVPGIVDFELTQEEVKTSKPQTPSAYRFGRLSHHSFFSRHHPQPQRVTHIQDITGKPVCVVRDEISLAPLTTSTLLSDYLTGMPTISVPIGDPQSNRNPQLSPDTWKKNLKDLASQVAKEIESRMNDTGAEQRSEPGKKAAQKEEPSLRDQGAKYSAETGRLIPASSQALTRRSRQGQRGNPSGKDGGVQTSVLQNQELLGGLTAPGVRFSGPVGRGPRAGLSGFHLPPRVPPPAFHSHSRHLQLGLGSPQTTFRTQLDHILPLLDWRRQGEQQAEEAAKSRDFRLLHWMEPLTRHLAEATHSGQQATYNLGAPLSDSTNRLSKRYSVLAALCSTEGEGLSAGAFADRCGSAPPTASPLHPSREALKPTPRASRTASRNATGYLQSIPEEDKDTTSTQDRKTRVHWQSPNPPSASQRGLRGENNQVKGRGLRSTNPNTETSA